MRKLKKGENGKVLVIGGSEEYVGAVALAGIAALRSGVDWVTVASPEKVGWEVNRLYADLVVRKLKGTKFLVKHVKELLALEKKHDIVLIGNGIGLQAKSFVLNYIKKTKKPLVIDADAVKVISIDMIDNAILTPHKGEFNMLMKNSNIKNKSQLIRKIRNNVILHKGAVDEIITKDRTYHNRTGNPGMTKAGTGDVLAGLCAGFYAQMKDPKKAARKAAYYNGLIGDILLHKKKGYSYLASDMVNEIKKIVL